MRVGSQPSAYPAIIHPQVEVVPIGYLVFLRVSALVVVPVTRSAALGDAAIRVIIIIPEHIGLPAAVFVPVYGYPYTADIILQFVYIVDACGRP